MSRPTFLYCGICGRTPKTQDDTPNQICKWWDPDDGWKFGALCPCCQEEYGDRKPDPMDFAFKKLEENGGFSLENILTDEDIADLI